MREVYPVVFRECKDDAVPYYVYVPDLDASTQGEDMADAIEMARDIICLKLMHLEKTAKEKPAPGSVEYAPEDGDVISYVDYDFERYKKLQRNLSVKKNCTIPQWLAEKAEQAGVNFSRVLQDALIETVGA